MDERRYDQGGEVTVALYEAVTSQMMLYGPYLGLLGVGAPIPLYAMAGQNYMEKYGVTPEDLAEVVLYQREHAFHQPDALFYQKKVSREEILQSPILSPPLRLHDCSTFVSGGACVILSFQPEGPSPVQIAGYGEYHGGDHFIPLSDPLERFPSVEKAFEEARESAGLSPEELEVVEIYDVFSPTHLVILEELSLAKRGRAIEKVREGKFTYGSYPVVNPTGGRIGFGHPAGATPLISLVEVVRQIGGKSNGKKIDPPPKTGLVQAEHGMLNGCYILIVKEGNL
jgi:acetyl-CoA C-acetyltransferase